MEFRGKYYAATYDKAKEKFLGALSRAGLSAVGWEVDIKDEDSYDGFFTFTFEATVSPVH